MFFSRWLLVVFVTSVSQSCVDFSQLKTNMQMQPWQEAVNRQSRQLGSRNWIVITEASFPALNRGGISKVEANTEVPAALEYVLNSIDQTQHVKPNIYLTRELRSMDNNSAPGIDDLRKKIKESLHEIETIELPQDSLMTLMTDANKSFEILVIRTTSAMPYANIFIELQPGYWDAEAEQQLRNRIEREHLNKIVPR
jgi:D-ribose pyranose/furanose isomerase RbsD